MSEKPKSIDPAALSAAIIAGAVAVFMTPGPYGWTSLIISLTLMLVILGYGFAYSRTTKQSLAISAVLGFSALPGTGFVLEYWLGCGSWQGIKCVENGVCTRVKDHYLFIGWLIVSALFYLYDSKNRKL